MQKDDLNNLLLEDLKNEFQSIQALRSKVFDDSSDIISFLLSKSEYKSVYKERFFNCVENVEGG